MQRPVKTVTVITIVSLAYFITIGSTALAQGTQSTAKRQATTGDKISANFISELISAAEHGGMRIIVIDGTAQQDKSAEPESAEGWLPTTADYDSLMMTMTPSSGSSLMKVQSGVLKFRELLKAKLAEIPDSITKTKSELKKKSPTGDLHPYLHALYWSILLLAFGAWVEHEIYVKRIVARWLEPDLEDNPNGYLDKIPLLLKRASLKIIGVILSMVVAFVTGSLMFRGTPTESIQLTIAALYIGYAACRLLTIIWQMILAPYQSQYRIPHFSNTDARRLYHWLWVISSINILLIMLSIWIGELGG